MALTSWQLMGTQEGINHGGVGLGAAHQEVHGGVGSAADLADLFGGSGAVGIFAVANGLVHIGFQHFLQDGGMGALQIVTVKTDHSDCLLDKKSMYTNSLYWKSHTNTSSLLPETVL